MIDGQDEFALFYDEICVSSTTHVNPLDSSHYDLMYLNLEFLDINHLTAKAFNSITGTIWDSEIMGYSEQSYYGRDYHIDISACRDTGQVPEPLTACFMISGGLFICWKKL